MAIPIILFLFYLLITNSLSDFIDYCIIGIKTFDNKIPYINLIKSNSLLIRMLAICIPLLIIGMLIAAIYYKNKKLLLITSLSIAEFMVVFPISDNIHFMIGSIPTLIGITYCINKIMFRIKINKKARLFFNFFFEYVSSILLFFIILYYIYLITIYFKEERYYSTLDHFKNIEISEEFEETIKKVDAFILNSEKDVYILNFDAAIYMIPINRYNKNFDMFNKGNFGSKGEEGQIEGINNNNAQYLIVKEGISRNWQNPEKVRKFIQQNLNKIGTIENFDVYKK